MTGSGLLFYGGIAIMAAAALAAITAAVVFSVAKKRQETRLESEYGKKRH